MELPALTYEMIAVLSLLAFTVLLFVTEIIRIDVAAILVMVLLGALSYLPGLGNLADVSRLFEGFSSNAVMSIIAVMIIGAGLDKTGLMSKVAALILKNGGTTEARINPNHINNSWCHQLLHAERRSCRAFSACCKPHLSTYGNPDE